MRGIQAEGDKRTIVRLKRLMKKANEDGEYRVARRIHGVILNIEGYSNPEISEILKIHRSKAVLWIHSWNDYDIEGLFEGHRSGRPPLLTQEQKEDLGDIIDSGPVAYGFTSGVWTSAMISRVINEEFGVNYHPGHVRKLLKALGFSVQRPRRKLALANTALQNKWRRYTYPNLKKNKGKKMR
jgi:transposase